MGKCLTAGSQGGFSSAKAPSSDDDIVCVNLTHKTTRYNMLSDIINRHSKTHWGRDGNAEVSLRCHSSETVHFVFWIGSLTGTSTSPIRLGWLPSEPHGPFVSTYPALGVQVSTTMPYFSVGAED